MSRIAAYPGNSRFERNLKYVHVSWLLAGATALVFGLALATEKGVVWPLLFVGPFAAFALCYGGQLFVGHANALSRRREAWRTGVPISGRVIAKAPSSMGSVAYWRVRVQTSVAGQAVEFEDRFVYDHVADRWRLGDRIELRYVPQAPEVFAFDLRF